MRRLWSTLLLLGSFASPAAFAQGLNPAGQNAWDYYVFGSGPAIYKILESVKLLMLPMGGGGMFRSLLIAIALIGAFLVIVEAGFSPSKGVERLIGYFVMLAFVMFFTMGARVNVTINDDATGYYNTVTGVPAIVGIPASVISEIGYHLEQGIEQDFSIPDGLKVSQSGMYDVMGQTLKDANEMVITDPDLKRSLAGYVENCVVPEIGLGRVSVENLMNSSDLLSTFQQAATPSLLTPYYPVTAGAGSSSSFSDQGTLEHCNDAYTALSTDVKSYANALSTAQSSQWQASGIAVPFETAMQDVLQEASAGGGGNPTVSGYSSPEGYILQSSLINSTRPAFQQAAADLGENPVMLSTAIAQADQTQRSSWYTTVTVFHNMIGYVYIVLQGFVLAMVPIIAVMLLLPGLGAKVFMNYLQVLLWLVLWGPLFSVDNFIVAVYGGGQLHNLLAPGLTMLNSGVMKESTVNLNLAASFLGTLIPLLAWGIVKGSFAFTEFIMHGMGTAFGQQAGSLAASGNISLGNTSLDNVGMNKYGTSITSDVGDAGAGLSMGAGTLSSNRQLGGYSLTAGKTTETPTAGYNQSWSAQIGHNRVEGLSEREAKSLKTDMAERASMLNGYSNDIQNGVDNLNKTVDKYGIHTAAAAQLAAQASQDYAQAAKILSQHQVSGKFGGSLGFGAKGLGGSLSLGADFSGMVQKSQDLVAKADAATKALEQYQTQYAHGQDADSSNQWDVKGTQGQSYKEQYDSGVSSARDETHALDQTISDMRNVQISSSYTESESQTMLAPGGAAGAVSVEPGAGLSSLVGESPMSAGEVQGVTGAADHAGEVARAAAGGVAGAQSHDKGVIKGRQDMMFDDQGTLSAPSADTRSSVQVETRELTGAYGDSARSVYYGIGNDRAAVGKHNTAVKTSGVVGTLLDGGVHVQPTA